MPTFRRRSFASLALAGALLLGLTAAAPTVSAQGDPAFTPYCIDGLEVQAEPGQDLLVVCGWGATTKGLLQMFIRADSTNFVLTDASGNVVWSLGQRESAAYWGKPYSLADSDQGVDCKEDTFWAADWQYTLPGLSAGTYTLTTTDAYRHPINDGYHTCSFDGQPISPTPSLYRTGVTTSVVTIVVAAP